MGRGSIIFVLIWALILTACQGRREEAQLTEQRDDATGFVVRTPPEWTRSVDSGGRTRFVPPGTPVPEASSEFIAVFVTDVSGPLDESGVRRLVFSALTIHGVSGFLQDPRTTPEARWDRFEVTGASGGVEWASVGVAVSGAVKTYVVVCAKPFDKWRDGQKQCDEVIRTFQPGRLSE